MGCDVMDPAAVHDTGDLWSAVGSEHVLHAVACQHISLLCSFYHSHLSELEQSLRGGAFPQYMIIDE
jgi:hypothetical protein